LPKAFATSPKLDVRDQQALVDEARALVPHYFPPQWNGVIDKGAGSTLLTIATRLLEGIIRRLNDVPSKNFIAFLDSIGIRLLPALPARAPITFLLTKGATAPASVPAHSQIAAQAPDGGDPIIFETETAILATPAQLVSIISVVPREDRVLDHLAPLAQDQSTELFSESEPNVESHLLYLSHADLFNVKGPASFELTFDSPDTATAFGSANDPPAVWEYWGEKEKIVNGETRKVLDWHPLTATVAAQKVTLVKSDPQSELKEVKINDINGRWIRARIAGVLLPASALAKIEVGDLKIAAVAGDAAGGVDPDAAFYNDLSLPLPPTAAKPLLPFGPAPVDDPNGSVAGTRPRQGDAFYLASQDAFSKPGASIIIKVGAIPPDALGMSIERVLEIGPIRAARLRQHGISTVVQLLRTPLADIARIIEDRGTFAWTRNVLEAAAKNFYDKVVTTGGGTVDANRRVPQLSWEYWNGKGWLGIDNAVDTTNALTAAGVVTFFCPKDIAATKVLGQENFWIRARIAFGDYGQEKVTIDSSQNPPVVQIVSSGIRPPEIVSLKLDYDLQGQRPQQCLTFNSLTYESRSLPSTAFRPFVPLDDAFDSLYLGFDRAPLKGPISIFFSLQEQEYAETGRPRVEWEYLRSSKTNAAGEWARLTIEDDTRNLTQSGTVAFIGPADLFPAVHFGRSLFWIRAIDEDNRFVAKGTTLPITGVIDVRKFELKGPAPVSPCEQAIETLTSFIKFPAPKATTPPAPIVKGVYLNTVWSLQTATIQDELVGSSDGTANQQFTLAKSPVIDEQIWVDELSTLTETERKTLTESGDLQIRTKQDPAGNVTAFLICWQAVEDITQSLPTDRAYAIDRTFAVVTFGDGVKHGLVPPIGKDNIQATYRAGGGSRGNLDKKLIKSLRSTIPLVDSAINLEPAGGGSDTELIEKALERGPQVLKNRGRAIANEDYEWLAKQASQTIVRATCIPTFNDQGTYETGWVTVIIIPGSTDPRPLPSPQLRQRVEKYLLDRAPNVATVPRHVKVIPPAYVAVRVGADVFPLSIDLAPQVESLAIQTLQRFLHPLTGGYDGTGWELGRFPCLSDFYRLLEEIAGVDHVNNLSVTLQPTTLLGDFTGTPVVVTEDRPVDVTAPPFALVYSGEHQINVKDANQISA